MASSTEPVTLPTPRMNLWSLALPSAVIALFGLLALGMQYSLDYEVTLLPWLLGRGWTLYRDLIDQHPPLFPYLLLFLGAAGDPGWPLRAMIVCLQVLTLALTYVLAWRIGGRWAGLAALVLAAFWTTGFDGLHLWYDMALGPVCLTSLLLLSALCPKGAPYSGADDRGMLLRLLALGLLLGAGTLVKQHVIVAIPFFALALRMAGVWARPRRLAAFSVGLVLPLLAAALFFVAQGTLTDAWYWLVEYSFTGGYTRSAALAPPAGEWLPLVALFLPLLAALLLWSAVRWRELSGAPVVAYCGVLLAATLPAFPRYGRYHLQAAIPLLSVAAGVAAVHVWPLVRTAPLSRRTVLGVAGLLLLVVNGFSGAGEWATALRYQLRFGSVQPPFASAAPLRAWVDAHAAPGSPIFVYELDPLLYRVLEREPPRPLVPQLPWLLSVRGDEERLWSGVERAAPPVVLMPALWWEAPPSGAVGQRVDALRKKYRSGARFDIPSYPGAPATAMLALLRNDGSAR